MTAKATIEIRAKVDPVRRIDEYEIGQYGVRIKVYSNAPWQVRIGERIALTSDRAYRGWLAALFTPEEVAAIDAGEPVNVTIEAP